LETGPWKGLGLGLLALLALVLLLLLSSAVLLPCC
jgi:hypothetical protein